MTGVQTCALPIFSPDLAATCIQLYDDDGQLLWERPPFVKTTYPGDTAAANRLQLLTYDPGGLLPFTDSSGRTYALSTVEASVPVRRQILLWGADSIPLNVYLHTGSILASYYNSMDWNGDGTPECFFAGTNNRFNRAALLVLNPFTMRGVSPPYDDPLFLASGMERGNALRYVAFPETPLSLTGPDTVIRNYVVDAKFDPVSHLVQVGVAEGCGWTLDSMSIDFNGTAPTILYYLDSNFIPVSCAMQEANSQRYNYYLSRLNRGTVTDFSTLYNELLRNTIVYYGDSIVHHPASGIDFYSHH